MITLNEAHARREFAARREEMVEAHRQALIAMAVAEKATVDAIKVGNALQGLAQSIAARAGGE